MIAPVLANKGYHTRDFVDDCRQRLVSPHVADKANNSMLDKRTTERPAYSISQRIRKRVEEIFGWAKTIGGFAGLDFAAQREHNWRPTSLVLRTT